MHFFKKSATEDEKQSIPEEDVEQFQHPLKKDAISVVGAAAMAIAFMGPAVGMLYDGAFQIVFED